MITLIVAKGTNAHKWGNAINGILQSVIEFRLPDASEFFPYLND